MSTLLAALVLTMPTDYSGLAWLGTEGDSEIFLAVHDVDAGEHDRARVSLLSTPLGCEPLEGLEFPVRGLSNDLESVARIPGEDALLLVESGGDDPDAGIYYATYEDEGVALLSFTPWPVTPDNVEATAVVADDDGQLWFVYAERAGGRDDTDLRWTTLDIAGDGGLIFGTDWRSIPFTRPGPPGARPASGLEIGPDGRVYVASATDPGDAGPFDSAVWWVGTWDAGVAAIEPLDRPLRVARIDGFKVESIAVLPDGRMFIGVDDEDYGATLRPLR